MRKTATLAVLILVLVTSIPVQGHAEQMLPAMPTPNLAQASVEATLTLQQGVGGYSGGQSTYIHQFAPDASFCASTSLKVGYKQQYAALVRFDLSSIPAGATVSQASLEFYVAGWSGAGISLGAHAITRAADLCQASWNRPRWDGQWGLAGANDTSTDRRLLPEATITISSIRTWYKLELGGLVQAWVSGTLPNNGLVLRQSQSSRDLMIIASNAEADLRLRPRLVVTYRTEAPTAPPTATRTPVTSLTLTATPTAIPTGALPASPTATKPATPSATPTLASPTTEPGEDISVTFQQGANAYSGGQSTYIHQFSPNSNYCSADAFKVGYKQQYAGLLRFELSSIPANATIASATLQIYACGWSGADISFGAYVITRTTDLCQVNWSRSQSSNAWGQPGANDPGTDRRAAPEGGLATHGIRQWYSFNVAPAVRGWVNGALPNNGLLLRQIVNSSSLVSFAGAAGDVNLRPKLTVVYHVGGPEPTATPDGLIIGHVTDAHVGAGPLESERLAAVVQYLNPRVQIILDSGDCTEHGTLGETLEYAQIMTVNAAVPWRAVLGNHDTPGVFQSQVGPLQWSWDVGNYRVIGINTESIDYAALDQALSTQKRCILVGHFPLDWCSTNDQALLRRRFSAHQVLLYISGHTHLDSQAMDPESGTVLLTGRPAGDQNCRIITIDGNQVQSIDFH